MIPTDITLMAIVIAALVGAVVVVVARNIFLARRLHQYERGRRGSIYLHDPVFRSTTDSQWYFYLKDWRTARGPFPTEREARLALSEYFEQLRTHDVPLDP